MNFPVNFYGVGIDSKFEDQEAIRYLTTSFSPAILRQIDLKQYFGLAFNVGQYEIKDFEEGKTLSKFRNFPEYNRLDYYGAGLTYDYDSRDKKFYPTRGAYFNVKAIYYVNDFAKEDLEYLYFKKLPFFDNWIWASRYKLEAMQNKAPLWILPEIDLRGIESTRFIDKTALNVEQELRFPIAKRWKGNLFMSAGNVAPDFFTVKLEKTKIGAGFGIRYVFEEVQQLNFVFDFAFHNVNDDDKKMYFYFKIFKRF